LPRYFFNILHGSQRSLDEHGEELPDKHAAWAEATKVAGQTIRDIDGKLRPDQDWRLEVRDEFGGPLWEIRVSAQDKRRPE